MIEPRDGVIGNPGPVASRGIPDLSGVVHPVQCDGACLRILGAAAADHDPAIRQDDEIRPDPTTRRRVCLLKDGGGPTHVHDPGAAVAADHQHLVRGKHDRRHGPGDCRRRLTDELHAADTRRVN